MLQITSYSVICSMYSANMMKYIGYIEICVGVGLGLGPTIGSLVFPHLHFGGTMFFFAGLNFLTLVLCICMIPNALNETVSDEEAVEMEAEVEEDLNQGTRAKRIRTKITFFSLFRCKELVFAALTCCIGTMNITFFTGWLENDIKSLGVDPANTGFILGSQNFVYLVMCLLLPYTFEHSPRRL